MKYMAKYAPNSAGWQLYPAGSPQTKANSPVRMPTVQRSKAQNKVLTNMYNSDARASSSALTGYQPIRSFKNGGKVQKTGVYKLHKGERVLSTKQLEKIVEKQLFNK